MIQGFRHEGLQQLFEEDHAKGANAEHARKIRQILALLDAATTLSGLDIQTYRLHPLKGDPKGFWSITVRANWRIIFRFDDATCRMLSNTIEGGLTMPMKNPPHPGEMIGDEIEALGVSISDAAKALGVTRQQLHNLIAGRSGITPEMAVRLEMAIGGSADTWVRLQTNYDLAQIRNRTIPLKVKKLVRP
jgi:addiction module HigA family antidote